MVSAEDYLEVITRPGRYVLVEKAPPDDRLTNDVITIKDADGAGDVRMPYTIFDQFHAKGYLRQDGAEDEKRRVVFVVSEEAYTAQSHRKSRSGED